eukprot:COSAG02_NODE_3257_length_7081_cov_3.996419_2_plen_473_part_00
MWNKLAGESLVLVPDEKHQGAALPPPRALRVQALAGAKDEVLGVREILLDELTSGTDWSTVGWYELRSTASVRSGELRLFMRWGATLGDRERTACRGSDFTPQMWHLHATVLRGSGLPRPGKAADRIGQAPAPEPEPEPELVGESATDNAFRKEDATYVMFFVEGNDVPLCSRRSATSEGNGEVGWGPDGDGVLFSMPFELPQPPPTLAIELLDAARDLTDATKHALISRGACDVGHILARWDAERATGTNTYAADEWVALKDPHGEPAGKLLVRMLWQVVGLGEEERQKEKEKEGEEKEEEGEKEHAMVRALREDLGSLSADQLISRLKMEMAGATAADMKLIDRVFGEIKKEAKMGNLQNSEVEHRIRESAIQLMVANQVGRILQQTADENQQRAFFVSVLECIGLPNHEETFVKVMCAGETLLTESVNDSPGHPMWRNGAGQTLAFIDVQQQGATSGADPNTQHLPTTV